MSRDGEMLARRFFLDHLSQPEVDQATAVIARERRSGWVEVELQPGTWERE